MAKTKKDELRELYEGNLFQFAQYINPHYVYGDIHEEVFAWLQQDRDEEAEIDLLNKLLLLPRDHLKSHCAAVYVVWRLTKCPWWTFVYLTAGDDLANLQMSAIKGMFDNSKYRLLWPEHIKAKESERDKWTTREINLDHPVRKERNIRDFSVIIKTLGSSATGLHCRELIYDDIVVPQNAYTESGRKEVSQAVADFSSVKSTGAFNKAFGTRYMENDIYGNFIEAVYPIIDRATGEVVREEKLWNVFERVVEDSPGQDGTGEYLWPRTMCVQDEQWYGWDAQQLAIKKAEYITAGQYAQYYSQYYNDPNQTGKERINKDSFMYIKARAIQQVGTTFYAFGKRLEIVIGMDCAWSDDTGNIGRGRKGKSPDWTAIVVLGLDEEGFYYILDIAKFRTSRLTKYYSELMTMCEKWHVRKVYIETNAAGKLIKQEIDGMIKDNSRSVVTFGRTRGRQDGTKEERFAMVLEPKYEAHLVYHRKCGYIHDLEEQLKKARPKFDDIKDAVTIAMENIRKPGKRIVTKPGFGQTENHVANKRFGGRRG